MKKKIIRITTVPMSLGGLLKGQIKYMTEYYDVIGVSSGGHGLLTKIGEDENIRVKSVEMTRKITPFKDLLALYNLFIIFKRESPFIVHTHTPKAGTLGMIAAKLASVPHRLHTIAGLPLLEETGNKRRLLNSVEKITYWCSTKIYPNSQGLLEIILKNNFTKSNKLKVLGNGSSNGIDTAHYDRSKIDVSEINLLKKRLCLDDDNFVFIYVGRLVKDKGINELVHAFININTEYPKTKLLLVGPYESNIDPLNQSTLDAIKGTNNIVELGWQDDVRPFFKISNCLVFPSYREGFPNVVMQAGAMELPSIVTNINGCNEIITEPENGMIIPVKNKDALVNAMIKMLALNRKDLEAMGEASRQMIVSKFEQQFVWNTILEEYNSL